MVGRVGNATNRTASPPKERHMSRRDLPPPSPAAVAHTPPPPPPPPPPPRCDFPPISCRLLARYKERVRRSRRRGGDDDDVLTSVALPDGEYLAGWVAVQIVGLYGDASSMWETIVRDGRSAEYLRKFRRGEGFPPGVEYKFPVEGGEDGRTTTAVSVSAPVYVDRTLRWVRAQIRGREETDLALDREEEERIFRAYEFQNPRFAILCGKILRRLFRVYGIVYCSMYGSAVGLKIDRALNSNFERFMYFCLEFDLLPEREMMPLRRLVDPIEGRYARARGRPMGGGGGGGSGSPSARGTMMNPQDDLSSDGGSGVGGAGSGSGGARSRTDSDELGVSSHGSVSIGKPHRTGSRRFGFF